MPNIKDHQVIMSFGSEDKSLVTVGITSYNYSWAIKDTLDSVLNQTFASLSLVVADDASTDLSRETVCEWVTMHSKRFKSVVVAAHERNRGEGATRNLTFHLATSSLVFVLDADNIIAPRCISRCFEVLERSQAAYAYPIIARFGLFPGLFNVDPWNLGEILKGNANDALALVRKTAWQEVGGYSEDLEYLIDYDFWLKLVAKGWRGVKVPEILAIYRSHRDSASYRNRHLWEQIFQTMRKRHPTLPWPN
jgi:glycosyltransferase involved in cell wall biosynthesis